MLMHVTSKYRTEEETRPRQMRRQCQPHSPRQAHALEYGNNLNDLHKQVKCNRVPQDIAESVGNDDEKQGHH